MIEPQPDIFIGALRIQEPVTTVTDLFVSAVCFYAFFMLTKHRPKDKLRQYLRFYFLSMGLATAIGGLVGHGFLYAFNYDSVKLAVSPWKLPGWLTSMFSIALLERAAIEYASPLIKPRTGKIFSWVNIIELLTFVVITFATLNFFYVKVHSAYGLLVVVSSFNIFVYYKTKSVASKTMLIAVGFAAVSAMFYLNEWALSKWFNHIDISHCFMTVAAYYFYKGSMKMEPLKT